MAQATKELITKTASKLFVDQGYKATTIRSIAERCGVTHANIIYHFGGKWELAKELIDRYAHAIEDVAMAFADEQGYGVSVDRYLLYWALHYAFLASHEKFAEFYVEFGNLNRTEMASNRYDFNAGQEYIIKRAMGVSAASTGLEFDIDMCLIVEADIQLADAVSHGLMSLEDSAAYYLKASLSLLRGDASSFDIRKLSHDAISSGVCELVGDLERAVF